MKQDKDNLEKQMMDEEYGNDVAGCLLTAIICVVLVLGVAAIFAFI